MVKLAYQTIQAYDLQIFNEECEALSNQGWAPVFNLVIIYMPGSHSEYPGEGGVDTVSFYQQWCKPIE